ncbi:MAG: ParB/RepB/Spo0J family partition protein [Desulfobacterales bacterium]|nr:ParB/RepB/Spo0J family partition protein [Pseudomonadota bacterium]MBU4355887.1 ParB/RepB/Spo0J family partition protein [Pseudomonadota bacterium]MCG2772012.1 ParB/RepB/Spo0J family partition protein [Desulfobacterales bacterium]
MMNPAKGKKLPGGGKCTRCEGLCEVVKKEKGPSPKKAPETKTPDSPKPGNEVYLRQIYPNPDQLRKIFQKEALEELAQSIKEQGLIEPLVVVESPLKGAAKVFMLVAGERRWKACQIAGLTMAPVRVIEADDNQVAEMALVENIQRQDLTPLEEAKAFKEMLDRGYTKEVLAQKLGFKQVWRVDERLSLINLSPKFKGVVFTPQGDHVTLQSENPDIGDGLEIVSWTEEKAEPPAPAKEAEKEEGGEEEETPPQEQEAEHPPDLSAFGFNIRFLLDPLAAMTAETVEMEGNFSNRPFRIRAVGDPSFFSVVMPMGL